MFRWHEKMILFDTSLEAINHKQKSEEKEGVQISHD